MLPEIYRSLDCTVKEDLWPDLVIHDLRDRVPLVCRHVIPENDFIVLYLHNLENSHHGTSNLNHYLLFDNSKGLSIADVLKESSSGTFQPFDDATFDVLFGGVFSTRPSATPGIVEGSQSQGRDAHQDSFETADSTKPLSTRPSATVQAAVSDSTVLDSDVSRTLPSTIELCEQSLAHENAEDSWNPRAKASEVRKRALSVATKYVEKLDTKRAKNALTPGAQVLVKIDRKDRSPKYARCVILSLSSSGYQIGHELGVVISRFADSELHLLPPENQFPSLLVEKVPSRSVSLSTIGKKQSLGIQRKLTLSVNAQKGPASLAHVVGRERDVLVIANVLVTAIARISRLIAVFSLFPFDFIGRCAPSLLCCG